MNRFLGPSGFYYGIKPDRRLKKEHLLRYLRRRFPHLALYLNPTYWQPWLTPKDAPSTYRQPPYFCPGLQFPFVMLRGTAQHKARRIRHPFGVFRLRNWRFDPPLYNLPMTRRIRQQRFRNVFSKKRHDSGYGASREQLAGALRRRHGGAEGEEANVDVSRKERSNPASPVFSGDKSTADSSEATRTTPATSPINITHAPSSSHRTHAKDIKKPKPTKKQEKDRLHPSGRSASPSSDTPSESGPPSEKPAGTQNTVDYQALIEIARRKKRELKKKRQTEREVQKRETSEQDYMKHLLDKARKRLSSSESSKPSRSSAFVRDTHHTSDKEPHTKATKTLRKRTATRPDFPFANVPPEFHKTPAAGNRFYWSETGPEPRSEKNKHLPNVLRKRHDDVLSGMNDAEPEYDFRDDSTERSSGTIDSGKTTHSKAATSSTNNSGKKNTKTHLVVPSATQFFESTASSSHSQKSGKLLKPSPVSQGALKTFLSKQSAEKLESHHKRKLKRKRMCRVDSDTQKAEKELRQRILANLDDKTTQDFLVYREDLMKLRENAWVQIQKRQEKRQKERRLKIMLDGKKRAERLKQTTTPKVKSPVKQYLSIGKFSSPTGSVVSKSSAKSLPADTTEAPVNPYFPKASNRREAFRAYVAKHLLRIKADLVYKHRVLHSSTPRYDQWGRARKTEIPLFDNKNAYLVKIIRKLMRTKMGFRYKYESRAEEFLTNFPFVEFQTYRKFPLEKMDKDYREKHYQRIKKLYRGQRLFKMMTPLRWYKTISKNAVENPFDFQMYSDAVDEFQVLADAQAEREASGDSPNEVFQEIGVYEVLCLHLHTPPFAEFQTQLGKVNDGKSSIIDLGSRNLTDAQIRPIAMCVMLSKLVDHLNVSNNLLSPLGARYVVGVCGHTENVSELNASGNTFDADACNVLYNCLRRPHCKIKKLWLRNCGFGAECAELIARVMKENRSVFLLDMGENYLSNVGNNDMIGLAIAENTALQYLDLSHNGFSEKASYLIFMGLKSNSFIRTFLFGHNHVGDKGCDGVYDALRNSDSLQKLDLEHCAITDKGAQAIANGITKNDSLKSLNLRNNPINAAGTTAILKAAANKEKLKSVDVSFCAVNAAFITSANATAAQREMFIGHTGEGSRNTVLPPYPIDLEALAAKAGKKKDTKGKK